MLVYPAIAKFLPRAAAVTVCCILYAGCFGDVEHTNPLDPLAPNFENVGTVQGTTSDRGRLPLSGATVQLVPDGRTTTTTSGGTFSFPDIPVGEYVVAVEAEGFGISLDTVTVELGKAASSDHVLNGLPTFKGGTFSTIHISRWWPENDLYRIDLLVEVDDLDGLIDIDSVSVEIPSIGFVGSLTTAGEPGRYQGSFVEAELNGNTVHSVVGSPLVVRVVDRLGSVNSSDPQLLIRVIDPVPVAADPQGLEVIDGVNPRLEWDPIFLPYEHSFTVEIVRVDNGVSTSVYIREQISSDSLSVVVPTTLGTGSYLWTIAAVDAFENLSRSKEAGFQVQ